MGLFFAKMNALCISLVLFIFLLLGLLRDIGADIKVTAELLVYDPRIEQYFSLKSFVKKIRLELNAELQVIVKKTVLPTISTKLKILRVNSDRSEDRKNIQDKETLDLVSIKGGSNMFFDQLSGELHSCFGIPFPQEMFEHPYFLENEVPLSKFNHTCREVSVNVRIDDFEPTNVSLWIWNHLPGFEGNSSDYRVHIFTSEAQKNSSLQKEHPQQGKNTAEKKPKSLFSKIRKQMHEILPYVQKDTIQPSVSFIDLFKTLPALDRTAFARMVVQEKARVIPSQPCPDPKTEAFILSSLYGVKKPVAIFTEEISGHSARKQNSTVTTSFMLSDSPLKKEKTPLNQFIEHIFLVENSAANGLAIAPFGASICLIFLGLVI